MIISIIQAPFYKKFSPVLVSKKRNRKESMIFLTPKLVQVSLTTVYKVKTYSLQKKIFSRKMGWVEDWTKNEKNAF